MDIIGFIYYKGLILTALNRLDEAIEQFNLVIGYPSNCTHKIHFESYKKLILLSLIQDGKMPSLPKYTSYMIRYKLENN